MYTIAQVLKNNPEHKGLINAVLNQLGIDKTEAVEDTYIPDIINHGVNGGFNGFIYYTDTVAFYRKNRTAINKWVISMAEEFGETAVDVVCNFNCIKDKSEANNVGRCLYDGKLNDNTQQIENALAWFAAEEVCRLFDN